MKKFIATALAAATLVTSAGYPASVNTADVNAASASVNYAEALQKSLFFYECQQAGPLPEWNRVEWRADSTMIDEIKGGWYDAGDHVKFNLPMAYSASMLAWGLYQYPEGIEKCGEMENYVNNLEFVLDYLAACDLGDEVVFQVGNGTIDHTWWGPVELYQYGMEDAGTSYEEARATLKASEGCSAVFGGMAAALAAGSAALKGRVDDAKLKDYVKHAENIFKLADASKSDATYNDSNASGFYRSSHFYDELFYASNWLYIATGDSSYLDKAKSYIPNLDKELGSNELKYSWAHCWDDVMQGAMLLYAINTNDSTYIARAEKHVNYLVNTEKKVEGKLAFIDSWGCARYAETSAFIAAVAADTVLKDKDTSKIVEFYENQINFVLGDNENGQSYVVGYGDKPAHNAHHRTAHGSWKNDIYEPVSNRHILYGALVGGPNLDGSYEDDRNNYINNEVATDYNAGFTAILCKMIDKYGGETDPSFPQKEEHYGPEFFVEALSKGADSSGITVSFKITNHSAWPARVQDNLSFRYFMDLSEVKAKGYDPTNIVIRCDRDQSAMYASKGIEPAVISPVTQYDGDIYYVEVTLPDGRAVLPVSEGMQKCEILLAFVMPDYQSGWDAENDPSNKEILGAKGTTDEAGTVTGIVSKYIPVYVNGKLYFGEEPDGKSASGSDTPDKPVTTKPAVTTAKPQTTKPAETTEKPVTTKSETTSRPVSTTSVIPNVTDSDVTGGNSDPEKIQEMTGDTNGDGKVDVTDLSTLAIALADNRQLQGTLKLNADVDGDGKVTLGDLARIRQYLSHVIEHF